MVAVNYAPSISFYKHLTDCPTNDFYSSETMSHAYALASMNYVPCICTVPLTINQSWLAFYTLLLPCCQMSLLTCFCSELTIFWHANSHVSSFWLEVTSNFKYSSFSDDSVCKMDVLCIQVPASGKTYLEK